MNKIQIILFSGLSVLTASAHVKLDRAKVLLRSETTPDVFHTFAKEKNETSKKSISRCIVPSITPPPSPIFENPNALEMAFYPNAGASNSTALPSQSVGLKFLAADSKSWIDALGTPPDTMGVVGPEQFITALNFTYTSFNKKTGKKDWVLDADPTTFGAPRSFENAETILDTGDPHIIYDKYSKRWYIVILLFDRNTLENSGIYLAVSDGPVITLATQWKTLIIPNNTLIPDSEGCIGNLGDFWDFPLMGIDKQAIYITGNMFPPSNTRTNLIQAASGSTLFVIPKESLLCGDEVIITAFRNITGVVNTGLNGFNNATLTPAVQNFDEDAQFGYLIGQTPYRFGMVDIWRVVNPGTSHPTLEGPFAIDVLTTAYNIEWVGIPEGNNPYGLPSYLEFIDDRLTSMHVRNGQLYAVHNIVVNKHGVAQWDDVQQQPLGDRGGSRWYQFDLTGDPTGNASNIETATTKPVLVQAGTIYDPRDTQAPLSFLFPSIMSNKREDLIVGGSAWSADTHAKAYFVSRSKNDPLGTMHVGPDYTGTVFAESSGIYTRSMGSSFVAENGRIGAFQRWGDYSMTSVDPEDGLTFWTTQETHKGTVEEVWVARLDA